MSKPILQAIHEKSGWDEWCFWCPGCKEMHSLSVGRPGKPNWQFDGNLESPTFTPSLLYPREVGRCHLFVRQGRIEYLGDCHHELAGQTVPMEPLPDWWTS